MQNLRDKLLKAGLVTNDQVKEAETKKDTRPPRPPRAEVQRSGPPMATLSEEERQRREAFAARDAELSEQRRRELAKLQESRLQSERAHKLRALVQQHRLQEPLGEVSFHYAKRSGKIGRLLVSEQTQKLLEHGLAAVVEDPGQPDAVIVLNSAAEKFHAIDPKSVRFWAGAQKPTGFEDVGGTEEAAAETASSAASTPASER